MKKLYSDTPDDLTNVDDVLNYVNDSFRVSPRIRLNYIKMLYDVLGYDISPDVALASVSESQSELVLSTAGGGKTTWSQIKVIQQKLLRKIPGDKILCLVYNKHNVEDMKTKHAKMVARLYRAKIDGLHIDDRINACTMHSFCEFIRRMNVAKLGLVGSTLLEDYEAEEYMKRAITFEGKIAKMTTTEKISVRDMISLYTLTKETLKPVTELEHTDVYSNLELESEFIEKCFARYETNKERMRKYDFIDILYKVYELLKSDKSALETVQEYFKFVVADEVQDFTPLMWEILKLFVSNGTPLVCVGDEDQNIYLFRGAELDNILEFKDRFNDAKVYLLTENRRCPATVLKEAKRVIDNNELRFNKQIVGRKPGGEIVLHPYRGIEGEYISVVNEVKRLSPDERNNTVICYRNAESSAILVDMLSAEDISINCLKAYLPYSHELYMHVLSILNALEMHADLRVWQSLWKVLPCKKAEFWEVIGYSPNSSCMETRVDFKSFNFTKLNTYKDFLKIMTSLIAISNEIETRKMSDYFPHIWKLLKKYFWNYRVSGEMTQSEKDQLALVEKRVYKTFNVDKTFSEVFDEIQRRKNNANLDTKTRNGVTLTTFHSLKGLEFDNVIVVDMDNEIFPNFPLIEYKKYDALTEKKLKEAETRLWYVTITRAKKLLSIYYFDSNPSIYVKDYIESIHANVASAPTIELEDFEVDEAVPSAGFIPKQEPEVNMDKLMGELEVEFEDLLGPISEESNSEEGSIPVKNDFTESNPVEEVMQAESTTHPAMNFKVNTTGSSLKNLIDLL